MTDHTATSSEDLVWYAAYGSNMDEGRLAAHLFGHAIPEANTSAHAPMPPVPLRTRPATVRHELYFAGAFDVWKGSSSDRGGAAFLSSNSIEDSVSYCRLYLLTLEQCARIWVAENHAAGTPLPNSEVEAVRQIRHCVVERCPGTVVLHDGWYGCLLSLGSVDHHWVLTFTSGPDRNRSGPPAVYVERIVSGLLATHDLDVEAIRDYLWRSIGGRGGWTEPELLELIANVEATTNHAPVQDPTAKL